MAAGEHGNPAGNGAGSARRFDAAAAWDGLDAAAQRRIGIAALILGCISAALDVPGRDVPGRDKDALVVAYLEALRVLREAAAVCGAGAGGARPRGARLAAVPRMRLHRSLQVPGGLRLGAARPLNLAP